jgi:hypothetical protein
VTDDAMTVHRIRWRPSPVSGSLLGYVGTLTPWVFQIWQPAAGQWMLMTTLPGLDVPGNDPQAPAAVIRPAQLQAQAEVLLLLFAAHLGVHFDVMERNISCPTPTRPAPTS